MGEIEKLTVDIKPFRGDYKESKSIAAFAQKIALSHVYTYLMSCGYDPRSERCSYFIGNYQKYIDFDPSLFTGLSCTESGFLKTSFSYILYGYCMAKA